MTTEKKKSIEAWGLSIEAINELPKQLIEFHERYRRYLRTQTRDTSEYGLHYMSSLIRMESKRNMANIGRTSEIAEQNMQQFMSDSPWRADHLIQGVQSDIMRNPQFASGSVLIIDESADEKAGEVSAGAGRQHNGRMGKVDCCQVGVYLGLANNGYQTWVDGELFIPEAWFAESQRAKRQRIGIPEGRVFATKPELALQLLERTQDSGLLSFDAVDMDALYGRNGGFRDRVAKLDIEYYADVPANMRIYLENHWFIFQRQNRAKLPNSQPSAASSQLPVNSKKRQPQSGIVLSSAPANGGCSQLTLLVFEFGQSILMARCAKNGCSFAKIQAMSPIP